MERLLKDLDYENNRFLFLYGEGLQDCFLSDDYREMDILESLWHVLKGKKFDCILFYSHTDRIFFFDQESRIHCLEPGGSGFPTHKGQQEAEVNHFFKGPLGRRLSPLLSRTTPGSSTQTPESPSNQTIRTVSRMMDSSALELMDWLMRDTTRRSAVVISQAETSLHYFGELGAQAGRVGAWAGLPLSNRNTCILLFATENLFKRVEDHPEFIPVPEITTYLQNSRQIRSNRCVLKVPSPERPEAQRILDYIRLVKGKQINWNDRDRMAKLIADDGKLGRHWLQILARIPRLDLVSLGPCLESSRPNASVSWREELDHLEGLSIIKNLVIQQEAYIKDRRDREHKGAIAPHEPPPTLHMAFLGNPGTGKTTIARLIGEMYRDLGLLKRGHVVPVEYKDLIGSYVGQTVAKTDEQIDKALEGVLFIDEAYQLAEDERGGFGKEAIDRILTRMENERSRLVVIVAGYTDPMQKFLQSNPGLTSRFPTDNHIIFPDYTPIELLNILRRFLGDKGLLASDAFNRNLQEVVENLYKERDPKTFGNARKMRDLAESVERMRATRRVGLGLPTDTPLEPEDLSEAYQHYLLPPTPEMEVLMAELNELIGLHEVKEIVQKLVNKLQADKQRSKTGKPVEHPRLNMLFVGNPGTGKTTVAGLMGKILKAVGVLRRGHVEPIRASDLIAGYSGQTAIKAKETLKKALDGVLFIDEAYQLTPGHSDDSFKTEAIGALMEYIDRYKDQVVVIMAGYPREMDSLMKSNPGLPGRFPRSVVFADYSDDELLEILYRKAAKSGSLLPDSILPRARAYFNEIRRSSGENFGNGREVENLLTEMRSNQDRRFIETKDDHTLESFEPEDVPDISTTNSPVQSDQHYLHYDLITSLEDTNIVLTNEHARSAVGLLQVKNGSGEGTGTGFVVTPDGHMLTAYHVVEGAKQVRVRLDGTETIMDAQVVGLDEQADLAVLRLPAGQSYPWLPLAEAGFNPPIGQDIGVFGYPLGQQFGEECTFTDGVVSSLRSGGAMIQISAPVTHGSSGGPVLRKSDLRVIGIIHGGANETGAGINFACNSQLVYLRFGTQPAKDRSKK